MDERGLRGLLRLLPLPLLTLAACADGGPTAPRTATVEIDYAADAVTAVSAGAARGADYPIACRRSILRPHVATSWKGPKYSLEVLAAGSRATAARRYRAEIAGAPVGREITLGIFDPDQCLRRPDGLATEGVTANGTRLTRLVSTADGPRFAFRLLADGTVVP